MSPGPLTREALSREIQAQWDLMVSVSTDGGQPLKEAQGLAAKIGLEESHHRPDAF